MITTHLIFFEFVYGGSASTTVVTSSAYENRMNMSLAIRMVLVLGLLLGVK